MKFNTDKNLHQGQLYPCCDRPKDYEGVLPTKRIAGIWTGETRPPKQGEWYISGAIPECYRAPNDLNTPHAIARIVETEMVAEYTIKPICVHGCPPLTCTRLKPNSKWGTQYPDGCRYNNSKPETIQVLELEHLVEQLYAVWPLLTIEEQVDVITRLRATCNSTLFRKK